MAKAIRKKWSKTDPVTGERTHGVSKVWYAEYDVWIDDRRVRKTKRWNNSEASTLREAIRLEEEAKQNSDDAFAKHRRRPLVEHIADYKAWLLDSKRSDGYARLAARQVQIACDGCEFVYMRDIEEPALLTWLKKQRDKGLTVQTSNYYLAAMKTFTRWLVMRAKRLAADPLAHAVKLDANPEEKRARRTLSEMELEKLLDAARHGAQRCGLAGPDREMLYLVALNTGFRCAELASLKPESFGLDSDNPTITVKAGYTKNRKLAEQPIHPETAATLRSWLADRPADSLLWPGSWMNRSAVMIRTDLKRAGIPFENADGAVFDFHSLRHQYITSLSESGAHPKDVQILARHSHISLTMDRYTHRSVRHAASALDGLPARTRGRPTPEPQTMAATGTDGAIDCRTDGKVRSKSPRAGCGLSQPDADGCKTGSPALPRGDQSQVLKIADGCSDSPGVADGCTATKRKPRKESGLESYSTSPPPNSTENTAFSANEQPRCSKSPRFGNELQTTATDDAVQLVAQKLAGMSAAGLEMLIAMAEKMAATSSTIAQDERGSAKPMTNAAETTSG